MLSKETFEINPEEHRKAKKIAKIRNLAKNNKNPAEKEAAEKKAGGPKLVGETIETNESKGNQGTAALAAKNLQGRIKCAKCGSFSHVTGQHKDNVETVGEGVMDIVKQYRKKQQKPERKPQKATDAGSRARRVLQRKEYTTKVSSIVPDELKDHKTWTEFKNNQAI